MKKKQAAGIILAAVVFVIAGFIGIYADKALESKQDTSESNINSSAGSVLKSVLGSPDDKIKLPDTPYVGRLDIVGEIGPSSGFVSPGNYDHSLYMDFVDKMENSADNKGIFLYVNSPGGTVYESDELYLKLKEYKEKTGRPIYAYFAGTAASGAYYISMAADKIYCNRNCMTGSIGVIMSMLNMEELYKKLGIREIDITSGPNKSMGSAGKPLTDEQRRILQSNVDEAYEQFTDIVADGRNMDINTVKKLADGRIYSAKQAMDKGLVDEIASEEDGLRSIMKDFGIGSDGFYSPGSELDEVLGFLNSRAEDLKPKSKYDALMELIEKSNNGELMYYAGK
ncbi:MAG: signal peptide peptidase SppA [Lachnospiraceae bacterium]|nr:signal peptide peptidase SppA [Lachnospiraceae bacterium]MEE3460963.1 signal peptide peptidase SppA [Lachnospiraceae bacterium]